MAQSQEVGDLEKRREWSISFMVAPSPATKGKDGGNLLFIIKMPQTLSIHFLPIIHLSIHQILLNLCLGEGIPLISHFLSDPMYYSGVKVIVLMKNHTNLKIIKARLVTTIKNSDMAVATLLNYPTPILNVCILQDHVSYNLNSSFLKINEFPTTFPAH